MPSPFFCVLVAYARTPMIHGHVRIGAGNRQEATPTPHTDDTRPCAYRCGQPTGSPRKTRQCAQPDIVPARQNTRTTTLPEGVLHIAKLNAACQRNLTNGHKPV